MFKSNSFIISLSFLFLLHFSQIVIAESSTILLQSTTSTQNSGLYDYILPKFTKKTGINVNVVAVGTGQAIKNATNGDGDVLLVHAKTAEEKFVKSGYGVKRYDVMYNDFVIIGPKSDPANIKGLTNVSDVLKKIAGSKSKFISRGDNSGTHKKEIKLWQKANIDPVPSSGTWYLETGTGMGATLNICVQIGAYTLTDRGTWIKFRNKQRHTILLEGNRDLFNQYGIILVNPKKHSNIKAKAGQVFIDWILSVEGQKTIQEYKIGGKQLFFPNAKPNS